MKLKVSNSIISLTGSNALHQETIDYLKQTSLIIYIDVDKEEILQRAKIMKYDRVVGQKSMTFSEILDHRRSIYEKNYDYRVLVGLKDDIEKVTERVVNLLNTEEVFVSTRSENNEKEKNEFGIYDVLSYGLAKDGGLYVPKTLPKLDESQLKRMINMNYQER